jgi:hypothetical protein
MAAELKIRIREKGLSGFCFALVFLRVDWESHRLSFSCDSVLPGFRLQRRPESVGRRESYRNGI